MIALLAFALLSIGLAIFGYPLLRRTSPTGRALRRDRLQQLTERYRNALADLQDAETDWQIGNLSPADYAAERERLRRAAAEALRGIATATEARERIRADLERAIAAVTATSDGVRGQPMQPANGMAHGAAEASPLAQRRAARTHAVPLAPIVGVGAALVSVAGIIVLCLRLQDAQASPVALSALPVAHAHVITLGEGGSLIVGHHGGLLYSGDGRTWEELLAGGDVMGVVRGPGGRSLIALGHDVAFIRDTPDGLWRPLEHDLPGTDVHGAGEGVRGIYAYVENYGIFLSRDAVTWEMIGPPLREPVNGLAVLPGPDTDDLFVVAGRAVLRTRDAGRTWAAASGAAGMALAGVPSAVAADVGTGALYAGTTDGLFRSLDRGSSWTQLPFRRPVAAIAARGERLTVVDTEGRLYLSRDGGGSWSDS